MHVSVSECILLASFIPPTPPYQPAWTCSKYVGICRYSCIISQKDVFVKYEEMFSLWLKKRRQKSCGAIIWIESNTQAENALNFHTHFTAKGQIRIFSCTLYLTFRYVIRLMFRKACKGTSSQVYRIFYIIQANSAGILNIQYTSSTYNFSSNRL